MSSLPSFFTSLSASNPIPLEPTIFKIYCAGSLLYSLERVATAFDVAHPTVAIEVEGPGRLKVIRHITELGDRGDIIMVADDTLIPLMMYNTTLPDTNASYADWRIPFAGNRIVLAYTNQSKYADQLTEENWFHVMCRPDVKVGWLNPLIDNKGVAPVALASLTE